MIDEQNQPELDDEGGYAEFLKQQQEADTAAQSEQDQPKEEGEQPAPEAEKAEPEKPQEAPEPFEGYSSLSEAARAHFDQMAKERADWEARWKAQHGQLAPFQRQASQLQAERNRLQKELAEAQKQAAESAAKNGEFEKKLAKYRESFPDEAEVIEGMVNPLREQLSQSQQALAEMRSQMQDQSSQVQRDIQLSELSRAHPDWQEVRQSADFNHWLTLAPANVTEIVRHSTDARENIEVLNLFKADMKAIAEQQQQQQQPKRPTRQDVAPTSRGLQSGLARPNAINDPEEAEWAEWLASQS